MRLAPVLVVLLAACAPAEPPRVGSVPALDGVQERPALRDDPAARRATSSDGSTLVVWRPAGGVVPCNEHFELEVWLERDGEPVEATDVVVRADMPAHGHGMNVQPRAFPREDGSYRVRGMLLHMAGAWVLSVHVVEPGGGHQATFDLDVG